MRMYLLTFESVLLAIYFVLPGVQSIRWLAISNMKKPTTERGWNNFDCSAINRYKRRLFDKEQLKICKKRPSFMKYVAEAAELAISECVKQTFHERWYCANSIKQLPKTTRDLRDGTKESAFLRALSTAALVFKVTQGCMLDKSCGCGKKPEKSRRRVRKRNKRWKWGKCHDNIAFGTRFSRWFLDTHILMGKQKSQMKLKNTVKMMMILHNNEAARAVVRDSMSINCHCPTVLSEKKCIKECTRQLPVSFSEIAKNIFDRYKRARQAELRRVGKDGEVGSQKLAYKYGRTKTGRVKKRRPKVVNVKEFTYLVRSRDFCNPVKKDNLPGTQGRECGRKVKNIRMRSKPISEVLKDEDKCDYLCCQRPHRVRTTGPIKVGCDFEFSMRIMDVKNKTCDQISTVYTCT